jgi:tRNA dimethylallyltransferase
MSGLTPAPGTEVICLAGPTASGKSAVALCLAEMLGGEIISVDSMQVYRGLDLGTAKPTPAERARVPHHLVDVVDVREPFDAARWCALASGAVRDLQQRGRRPILCGGTGLYLRAFREGLGEAPPADAALRAELEATPLPELLRELATRDPVTFARVDRQNPRRVIRALEVLRLTGRPFSEQRARWLVPPAAATGAARMFALQRQLDDLHARIASRVERMFAAGLVEETRQLLAQGLGENRTALQALGYRQVVEHLRGARGLTETIALVQTRTRQFARRQMTWFRRQSPACWLAVSREEAPELTARRVLAAGGLGTTG